MSSKTILITGCSAGGIGAAFALVLAKRGHHVFATARTVSKIPLEVSKHPNVTILPLDVTSAESVAQAVQAVATSNYQLDVLLNNAGVGYSMPVLDLDVNKAKQVYDVNVLGVIRTIKGFAELLIKSKGRIVNLSTCGATLNTPWISGYCSSKAALNTISETLRLELSPFGVSVVTIMAGVITTHFHENEPSFRLPDGSLYGPIEEIIAGWASGKSKPKGCTPEQFAESLAGDVVGGGNNSMIWKGPHAGGVKFLAQWLPNWCRDTAMSINQGLKELKEDIVRKGGSMSY